MKGEREFVLAVVILIGLVAVAADLGWQVLSVLRP
jgi:hypothetical protein